MVQHGRADGDAPLTVDACRARIAELERANADQERALEQLQVREQALHAMSLTDELTGLCNRRAFLAMAEQQIKIVNRSRKDL